MILALHKGPRLLFMRLHETQIKTSYSYKIVLKMMPKGQGVLNKYPAKGLLRDIFVYTKDKSQGQEGRQ